MNITQGFIIALAAMSLGACFHEKEEETVPGVPAPNLSKLSELNDTLGLSPISLTNTETALGHLNTMFRRLLSVVDTTNKELDLIGYYDLNIPVAPANKVSSRALDFEQDSAVNCVGSTQQEYEATSLSDLRNTEVILWDDVDGNREKNAGDVWIRFTKSCIDNNQREIEGVVSFHGLENFTDLAKEQLNLTAYMDYQIKYPTGEFFIVKNLKANIVRDLEGYSTMSFAGANTGAGALIGYGTPYNKEYIFKVDDLLVRFYQDPESTEQQVIDLESFEFSGSYASLEDEGRIDVSNSSFVFDYDSQALRNMNITFSGADATAKVQSTIDYSTVETQWNDEPVQESDLQSIFNLAESSFDIINMD